MSRPEMFLVDEPRDAFICDPHQLFRGWLVCHEGSPTRYTLKFDGKEADVSWDSRPDVEAAYPDYAALGWQAHCDTLQLICEGKRSVTLSVWLDGTQVASRRFLISRCSGARPGRARTDFVDPYSEVRTLLGAAAASPSLVASGGDYDVS